MRKYIGIGSKMNPILEINRKAEGEQNVNFQLPLIQADEDGPCIPINLMMTIMATSHSP